MPEIFSMSLSFPAASILPDRLCTPTGTTFFIAILIAHRHVRCMLFLTIVKKRGGE